MSAGPGKVQKAILNKLISRSSTRLVFQNKILWELALERGAFERTGNIFGTKHQPIEEGLRKKSFEISFRRAVMALYRNNKILTKTFRLSDLNDILSFLPYLTDKLEVYYVRRYLLPEVKKYINTKNPVILHRDFDPFGFQLNELRENHANVYEDLFRVWVEIESEIVTFLKDTHSPSFDSWIEVLRWGRYYFRETTSKIRLNLSYKTSSSKEKVVVDKINALVKQIESHSFFKVGSAKKVLYALFHLNRFGGGITIDEDLRDFLFNKNEMLLRSLPGYSETDLSFTDSRSFAIQDYKKRNREYSPLLNMLFNRQIFKELTFLELVS